MVYSLFPCRNPAKAYENIIIKVEINGKAGYNKWSSSYCLMEGG
jgi:hypothetical protein